MTPLKVQGPLRLFNDGAELHQAAISSAELVMLRAFAGAVDYHQSGIRIFDAKPIRQLIEKHGSIGRVAAIHLGRTAHPVRMVLFDKTAAGNWSVGWHQDRTIAVRERRTVPGFGPWTVKAGVPHVEPPFNLIVGMITVRVHLDDCGQDNAPLLVAPSSHQLGRIPVDEIGSAVRKLGQCSCLARAGDIWAYASSIVHASERARIPSTRRILQIDYANSKLPEGLEWFDVCR